MKKARATLGDVLGFVPEAAVGKEDLDRIRKSSLANRSAEEVASMHNLDLANVLKDEGIEPSRALQVVTAIKKTLEEAGFAPTTAPVTVKVELPKDPDRLSVRELLELLRNEPNNDGELLAIFRQKRQVTAALAKSTRIAITDNSGRLDVEATANYIARLTRQHSEPQLEVGGKRPVTIEKALGVQVRTLLHPFTGQPIDGPDQVGHDYERLNPELHEAIIWARTTRHPLFPSPVDLFTHGKEILQPQPPERWTRILGDFQAAKAEDDPVAKGSTRYFCEAAGTAGATSSGSTPEAILRAMAQSFISLSGMSARQDGGVCSRLEVSGMGTAVDNVVVLSSAVIAGMNVRGAIYCPTTANIQITGMNCQVQVHRLTLEQLLQRVNG